MGTESGSIYKCVIAWPNESDVSNLFEEKSSVRWKQEALLVLANLANKSLNEVRKKIERYAQDKGEKEIQV